MAITYGDVVDELIELHGEKFDSGIDTALWYARTGIPQDDAIDILDALGADDPAERVEWFNASTLDIEDVVRLADVEFVVTQCDDCGAKWFVGYPEEWRYFQGVMEEDGGTEIEGVLNGERFNAALCMDCYNSLRKLLGV